MILQPPPSLPLDVIRAFVADHYGLDGNYEALDGERDQNHRLRTRAGSHVVKVCNPEEGEALADAQARALWHIASVAPGLPVPRCHKALHGSGVPLLLVDGHRFPVLLLSWQEGAVVDTRQLSHAQYVAWGEVLGQLNAALRDFHAPAIAARTLAWNTALFQRANHDLSSLTADEADWLLPVIQTFEREVAPHLAGLPHQIIHGDVHPHNTLVSADGRVTGIIDFGDMIHAPRLLDLSNAIADCLVPGHDFAAVISGLAGGFARHVPLHPAEARLILPLAELRLVMTLLISRQRLKAHGAITPQIAALASLSIDVLQALRSTDMTGIVQEAIAAAGSKTA